MKLQGITSIYYTLLYSKICAALVNEIAGYYYTLPYSKMFAALVNEIAGYY